MAKQRIKRRPSKDPYAGGPGDRRYRGMWCPEVCPITLRPFFLWIMHPDRGYVPTYGGPYDSYTIPEAEKPENHKEVPRHEVEYSCLQFDHDEGCWQDDEQGSVPFCVVAEDFLIELGAWK